MKTIATATVLLMLSASAWADESESRQINDPAESEAPIVLSEAEMDAVVSGAAAGPAPVPYPIFSSTMDKTEVSSADRGTAMIFQSYALYPHM